MVVSLAAVAAPAMSSASAATSKSDAEIVRFAEISAGKRNYHYSLPAIAAQQIPPSGLTVDCIAFLNIFGANVTSTLGMAALRRVQIGRPT